MKSVIWTPRAEKDLAAIHAYIATDSLLRAQLVVRKIIRAVDRAAAFPSSGRIVPEEGDPAVREVFVYSYRIVYEIFEDALQILTVHHGAMLLDPDEQE